MIWFKETSASSHKLKETHSAHLQLIFILTLSQIILV